MVFKITQELRYGFIYFLFCFENFVHTHILVYVAPNLGKFMNNLINFFVTSQQYRKFTRSRLFTSQSQNMSHHLRMSAHLCLSLPNFAHHCLSLADLACLCPYLPIFEDQSLTILRQSWKNADNLR